MKKTFLLAFLLLSQSLLLAQKYSRQDSLRGSLNPMRTCYDVFYYDLDIRVNPEKKFISGSNTIHYKVVEEFSTLQIDLFENLKIEKITHNGKELSFEREGNATFVKFPKKQKKGDLKNIQVFYSGKPIIAKMAPWDGGFTWEKDRDGNTWIGVSCEGIGASLWWPNKDHLSEEPDSMRISCEVPKNLVCVANGNLKSKKPVADNYMQYDWRVSYPINNYNVTLNIANYVHFNETYTSPTDGDTMSLDYYVLPYNIEKAKEQFKQVKPMLACYEKLFGKYPFWNDGFALVETPYLGMEHQGAIAYGNGYDNGYTGSDLSGSGVGKLFDYIIIHETGHEYWGNSVSCQDHAEMWIHESWCTYTEVLYVECMFGKEKADQYVNGYRNRVYNNRPIVAPLGVNADGSGDMYFKGALILHTLRNVIDNDEAWFKLIYNVAQHFQYKTTNTKELIEYINAQTGKDFRYFFMQYLYFTDLPTLEYQVGDNNWVYRWSANVEGFSMPIKITVDGKEQTIIPTTSWQILPNENKAKIKIQEDLYYIRTKKVK